MQYLSLTLRIALLGFENHEPVSMFKFLPSSVASGCQGAWMIFKIDVTTTITPSDKSQAIGDRVSAAASHVQYFPDAYTNRPTTHHLPTRTPPFHQATLTRRSRPRAPTPIPISDDPHFPQLGKITFPRFHRRLAVRLYQFSS